MKEGSWCEGIPATGRVCRPQAERTGQFAGFAGTLTDLTVANILQNRAGCAAAIAASGRRRAYARHSMGERFPHLDSDCVFRPGGRNLIHNYVPLPNVGGYYYQASPNQHSRENQGTVRVDHTFNEHNTFTGYYYVDDGFDENPFTRFQAVTNNLLPGFGSNNATPQPADQSFRHLDAECDHPERSAHYLLSRGAADFSAFQRTGAGDRFLHRGGGELLLQRQSRHAA